MESAKPTSDEPLDDSNLRDREHLRVLGIFHYLLAILTFLVACLFLVHLLGGVLAMNSLSPEERSRLPSAFGSGFDKVGVIGLAGGWMLAALNAISGWCLMHRKLRVLSIVVAACDLAWPPVGTGLGVITMIILARQPVRLLYRGDATEGMG